LMSLDSLVPDFHLLQLKGPHCSERLQSSTKQMPSRGTAIFLPSLQELLVRTTDMKERRFLEYPLRFPIHHSLENLPKSWPLCLWLSFVRSNSLVRGGAIRTFSRNNDRRLSIPPACNNAIHLGSYIFSNCVIWIPILML